MNNFYIQQKENEEGIYNKEDISLLANSISVFETEFVFNFRNKEEIIIKGCLEDDDINIVCQILKERDDKNKFFKLVIINSHNYDIIIKANTKITKILHYQEYNEFNEEEIKDYRRIFDNYKIKVFVQNECEVNSIEVVKNEDSSPRKLCVNFRENL